MGQWTNADASPLQGSLGDTEMYNHALALRSAHMGKNKQAVKALSGVGWEARPRRDLILEAQAVPNAQPHSVDWERRAWVTKRVSSRTFSEHQAEPYCLPQCSTAQLDEGLLPCLFSPLQTTLSDTQNAIPHCAF